MSTISIERKHSTTLAHARQLAEQVADELKQDFGLDWLWQGDALHFQRPGVKGQLLVGSDRIKVDVKLGLLMSALKGRIETEITGFLDEKFG